MTDLELQLKLAAMLPEKVLIQYPVNKHNPNYSDFDKPIFRWTDRISPRITPLEWLHVCWLIEQGMNVRERSIYTDELGGTINQSPYALFHKSWQQRARALIATLGETKGEK